LIDVLCAALAASPTWTSSLCEHADWCSSAAAVSPWLARSSPHCGYCHSVCDQKLVHEKTPQSNALFCTRHTGRCSI